MIDDTDSDTNIFDILIYLTHIAGNEDHTTSHWKGSINKFCTFCQVLSNILTRHVLKKEFINLMSGLDYQIMIN